MKQECLLSPLLLNILLEILANTIRQEKEVNSIPIGKEEVKLPLFTENMIIYIENPKEATQNPPVSLHGPRRQSQYTASVVFLYTSNEQVEIKIKTLLRIASKPQNTQGSM